MSLKNLNAATLRKIAIANPKHARYGTRAEEALRAVGLSDKLQDNLIFRENTA